MLVIGDGPARARLEGEARALGLERSVSFLGWVAHDLLPPFWRIADVGLLPFHRCPHIDTTLANKLFDYMAVGLAVLASDAAPMVRVLGETGAGMLFRAGSADEFAGALATLLDDFRARREMGDRGRRAVDETYNWARDSQRLLEVMERP